ncbi:hypothetical protein GCM10025858_22230 [Alicyclobacillus sacchari]|nr:hypothetical protein GCM10025858_22230 [Alicyclobacillus sacchari]
MLIARSLGFTPGSAYSNAQLRHERSIIQAEQLSVYHSLPPQQRLAQPQNGVVLQ